MYKCVICHAVNHLARLHCQFCGAVPVSYSITGKVCNEALTEMIVARNALRAGEKMHASRGSLKTVSADYYAEE